MISSEREGSKISEVYEIDAQENCALDTSVGVLDHYPRDFIG